MQQKENRLMESESKEQLEQQKADWTRKQEEKAENRLRKTD